MCDCATRMNAHLAKFNGRLATGLQITPSMDLKSRLLVGTEKIDPKKRKPVPSVMASFCPFCGEKAMGDALPEDGPILPPKSPGHAEACAAGGAEG